MTIFTIDSENNIVAHGSASEITDKGSEQFTSEKELAQLAADWPGSRLVDIWNRIPGLTPVKQFTNRAWVRRQSASKLHFDKLRLSPDQGY